MKISLKNSVVTAEAETLGDVEQLLSLRSYKEPKAPRADKGASHRRQCPHGCGAFKKLGMHMLLKHNGPRRDNLVVERGMAINQANDNPFDL